MTQRTSRLMLVLVVSVGLCGCAAAGDNNPSVAPIGGSIELALSETCDFGSDPQCIPVGNEHVMRPSDFEEAAVETAVASNDNQQNSVGVTLTDKGAKVLNDLTTQAGGTDTESRLLMKVGDEISAAVAVEEPLRGNHVTLGLSPEDDPAALIEQIRGS